jgi:hypothetical protein
VPILTFVDLKDRHNHGPSTLMTTAGPVAIGSSGDFTAAEQTFFSQFAVLQAAANGTVKVAKPVNNPYKS